MSEYQLDTDALEEDYARIRVGDVMPFGKHQGKAFADIPGGYLRHILTFDNIALSLRGVIDRELARRHPPGDD